MVLPSFAGERTRTALGAGCGAETLAGCTGPGTPGIGDRPVGTAGRGRGIGAEAHRESALTRVGPAERGGHIPPHGAISSGSGGGDAALLVLVVRARKHDFTDNLFARTFV
jgi:hypothetical protein